MISPEFCTCVFWEDKYIYTSFDPLLRACDTVLHSSFFVRAHALSHSFSLTHTLIRTFLQCLHTSSRMYILQTHTHIYSCVLVCMYNTQRTKNSLFELEKLFMTAGQGGAQVGMLLRNIMQPHSTPNMCATCHLHTHSHTTTQVRAGVSSTYVKQSLWDGV